jgi:hypothetical protein
MDEVTSTDLEKLLILLREYTEKLREIGDERLSSEYRRVQSRASGIAMAVILIGFGSFLAWNFRKELSGQVYWTLLIAIIGAATAAVSVTTTGSLRRGERTKYDSEQVSATIERLIRLASQYNDHARNRISDQFEFELRLAEAEGVLRTYRKLFHTGRGSDDHLSGKSTEWAIAGWSPTRNTRELLSQMKPRGVRVEGEKPVVITGDGLLETLNEFEVPVQIKYEVKVRDQNLRIYFGRAQIIFNWEMNRSEMRINEPVAASASTVGGKGEIPVNKWVTVLWTITGSRMVVSVDGEERASTEGPYEGIWGRIGVGTHGSSMIWVRSVEVSTR